MHHHCSYSREPSLLLYKPLGERGAVPRSRKRRRNWEHSTGDHIAGEGGRSCSGADLKYQKQLCGAVASSTEGVVRAWRGSDSHRLYI